MWRQGWVQCLGLMLLVSGLPSVSSAQEGDVSTFWAKSKSIKIARFHSFWVFTGQDADALNESKSVLEALVSRFNSDFYTLPRSRASNTPQGVEIISRPPKGLYLVAPSVKWNEIQAGFNRLESQVGADDVIFCYIMAHGELDKNDRKVYLDFAGEKVLRETIAGRLEALQRKRRARLVVFITDNCSRATPGGTPQPKPAKSPHIWRALYFGHEGFVDLSSTMPGELGFAVGNTSVFVQAFSRSLDLELLPETRDYALSPDAKVRDQAAEVYSKLVNQDANPLIDWREFEGFLNKQMKKVFDLNRDTLKKDEPILELMNKQQTQQVDLISAGTLRRVQ